MFAVCFACFGSLSAGVASLTPQVCLRAGEHWPNHAIILSPERGAKPVTNFVKNLSALSDWYSVYTSAIAFTVSAPGGVGCILLRLPKGLTLALQDSLGMPHT